MCSAASLREARRDKYLMAEAVRARGLRTAAQFHGLRLSSHTRRSMIAALLYFDAFLHYAKQSLSFRR
jgi:hypothetical protein